MADLAVSMEVSSFAKSAFERDMRLMAEMQNVDLGSGAAWDAAIEASLHRFIDKHEVLIEQHGLDAVMGCGLVDIRALNALPDSDRVRNWQRIAEGDRVVHSNRFVFDMTQEPPHIPGWVVPSGGEAPVMSMAHVDAVAKQDWAHTNVPIQMRLSRPDGENFIALSIPGNENTVAVREEYLSYFCSKLSDPVLQCSSRQNLLRVLDGDKLAGIIAIAANAGQVIQSKVALARISAGKQQAFEALVNEVATAKQKHLEQTKAATPPVTPVAAPEVQAVAAVPALVEAAPESEPVMGMDSAAEAGSQIEDWTSVIPAKDNAPATGPMPEGFTPKAAWIGQHRSPEIRIVTLMDDPAVDGELDELPQVDLHLAGADPQEKTELSGVQEGSAARPAEVHVAAPSQASPVPPQPHAAQEGSNLAANPAPEATSAATAGLQSAAAGVASKSAAQAVQEAPAESAGKSLHGEPSTAPETPEIPKSEATFDLGEPIDAPYAPTETYKALLEERLSRAVSPEHEIKIIHQEALNLSKSEELARQQAEHFEALLRRFGPQREVDATAYVLGRLFDESMHVWSRTRHPMPTPKSRVDANLDHLDLTLDGYVKSAEPMIQAPGQTGGVNAFRRNTSMAALSDIDNSLALATQQADSDAQDKAKAAMKAMPVADRGFTEMPKFDPVLAAVGQSSNLRGAQFTGDPAYLATKTHHVFNGMRPEHLINKDQEIDQTWVKAVKAKLGSITEKLSIADLSSGIREHIKAMIDSITATFTALVESAKKLFGLDKTKELDGGRVDPTFAGLER